MVVWYSVVLSLFFFFSSRRRHTRCSRDWSSDVCSSDLQHPVARREGVDDRRLQAARAGGREDETVALSAEQLLETGDQLRLDRKSTRLNSSHGYISYAVFCLKKKKKKKKKNNKSQITIQ